MMFIIRFIFRTINKIFSPLHKKKKKDKNKNYSAPTDSEKVNSPSGNILRVGGLSLLLLGMIYGGIYGAFFLEKIHEIEAEQIRLSIYYASEGQFEMAEQYHKKTMEVGALIDGLRSAHAHLSMFAVISLALACNIHLIKLKEKWKAAAASIYLMGSFVFPIGIVIQPLISKTAGKIVSIVAGSLIIASITLYLWGAFIKNSKKTT